MEYTRNDYLVSKKFYRYLIPSFLSEMAMHMGSVIDAVIVGNLIGVDALSAVTLASPIIQVLHLPGLILGLGGATLAAIWLGERKLKAASDMFAACVITGIIFSSIGALTAFWINAPLAHLVAVDPRLVTFVEEYLFINLLGLPIMTLVFLTCEFLSVDNHPDLGAWMFSIAEAVNVVFDIVLVKFAGMGMEGAAAATIIGYACGLITLVFYARSKERMLKFNLSGIAWFKDIFAALKTGTPRVSLELMQALQIFVLNTAVLTILGVEAMEIYAVCSNTLIMAELLAGGIISVIPNICGVLYGEKDFFGIRRLMKKVLELSGILISVLTVVFLVFPEEIALLFGLENEDLLPTAATCLRIYSLSFVLYVFNEFLQHYYQTILETMLATLDTILEFFVLLIPITFLLMHYYGIYGVCAAVPISELLTIIIVEGTRKFLQERGKLPQEGLLMIPNPKHDDSLDVTIEAGEKNAVGISTKIIDYCRARHVDERTAYVLGLAAEEIAINISRYGYSKFKKPYIDINLSHDDEQWILRIRDDGIPFDPTQYHSEEEGQFLLGGINVIKGLAKNFTYTRVLNMNNTIIEV
ncbi:MAG: ATP-binding protein [Selenomonadaceae bacterium]|nr:ATP-binding protein [Selenomonadaceae bacterium]